jgi:hypothetical protein
MDLSLKVSDLLLPPYPHEGALREKVIGGEGGPYRVRFRIPTGADQEAALLLAIEDPVAAAGLVLRRCVEEITAEGEDQKPLDDIPPAVAAALPQIMAALDPQAELVLDLRCPVCQGAFSAPFDTLDFFRRELAARSGDLFGEVHLLALHYHWSEAEIMGMTAQKRRVYLDLLAGTVGRGRVA